MSNYKCLRCGYESDRLSNFKNHLNRKFVCKPLLRDINIQEIKKFYVIEEDTKDLILSSKIPNVSSKIYPKNEDNRICEYCKKVFKRQFPTKHFYVLHAHIPDKRPYTFYHIGNVYDPRKNFNKILVLSFGRQFYLSCQICD